MALASSATARAAAGKRGPAALRNRSAKMRAYALLSPALLLMLAGLLLPVLMLVGQSFVVEAPEGWHVGLANYGQVIEGVQYQRVLARSVGVAALVAFLTVLLAYPAAYFIAFHVTSNKMTWLILITLPFWTSYPPGLRLEADPRVQRGHQLGPGVFGSCRRPSGHFAPQHFRRRPHAGACLGGLCYLADLRLAPEDRQKSRRGRAGSGRRACHDIPAGDAAASSMPGVISAFPPSSFRRVGDYVARSRRRSEWHHDRHSHSSSRSVSSRTGRWGIGDRGCRDADL